MRARVHWISGKKTVQIISGPVKVDFQESRTKKKRFQCEIKKIKNCESLTVSTSG